MGTCRVRSRDDGRCAAAAGAVARREHVHQERRCGNRWGNAGGTQRVEAGVCGKRLTGSERRREGAGACGRGRAQLVNSRPSVRARPSAPSYQIRSAPRWPARAGLPRVDSPLQVREGRARMGVREPRSGLPAAVRPRPRADSAQSVDPSRPRFGGAWEALLDVERPVPEPMRLRRVATGAATTCSSISRRPPRRPSRPRPARARAGRTSGRPPPTRPAGPRPACGARAAC